MLRESIAELAKALEVASVKVEDDRARFNIAPQQQIAAAREGSDGRELVSLKWGLVPAWAKDAEIGGRLINARSETVTDKPSFREAFRRRRCLIPASSYYEWKRVEGGRKQPYLFKLRSDQPFAFAGLWERWERGGKALETCTILTTNANEVLAPVHDRMPVILDREVYDLWLDRGVTRADDLTPLLRPYPAEAMTSHAVGLSVNKPTYDSEDLIAPIAPAANSA